MEKHTEAKIESNCPEGGTLAKILAHWQVTLKIQIKEKNIFQRTTQYQQKKYSMVHLRSLAEIWYPNQQGGYLRKITNLSSPENRFKNPKQHFIKQNPEMYEKYIIANIIIPFI